MQQEPQVFIKYSRTDHSTDLSQVLAALKSTKLDRKSYNISSTNAPKITDILRKNKRLGNEEIFMKATEKRGKVKKREKRSADHQKKVLYMIDHDHLIPKSTDLPKKSRNYRGKNAKKRNKTGFNK